MYHSKQKKPNTLFANLHMKKGFLSEFPVDACFPRLFIICPQRTERVVL